MTLFLAAIAVALCAFAIFTVIPGIFGVFELLLSLPLAQLISFRSILTVFFLGIGICYLLPAFLSRNKLRRIIASIAAICLLTSGAAHGMTVISRGLYFYDNLAQIEGDAKSETPHLNVLTYNTKGGATTTSDIVKIMLHDAIDVAVLPETSTQQGEEIQQALAAAGVNFQRFDTQTSQWEPDFSSTVILVSGKLGEYRQLDLSAISGKKAADQSAGNLENAPTEKTGVAAPFSIVGVAPADTQSKLPRFYGVHPIAPLPSLMQRWKAEITKTYSLCKSGENFVLAGDFNSTADHQAALEISCRDAVKEARMGGLGTWPAKFPVWLSAPIDRVLTGGNNYRGAQAKIVKAGASDHAGIVVQLRAHEFATAAARY